MDVIHLMQAFYLMMVGAVMTRLAYKAARGFLGLSRDESLFKAMIAPDYGAPSYDRLFVLKLGGWVWYRLVSSGSSREFVVGLGPVLVSAVVLDDRDVKEIEGWL